MAREGISGESSERVEEASLPADSEAASSSQADMTADGESRSGSKPGMASTSPHQPVPVCCFWPAREMFSAGSLCFLLQTQTALNATACCMVRAGWISLRR